MMFMKALRTLLPTMLLIAGEVRAEHLRLAVAASFKPTLEVLAEEFKQQHELRIDITSGATGSLAAQISHGAPYDIFLAADRARPEALEAQKLTRARKTYAWGRLVFWLRDGKASESSFMQFRRRVAIANPRHAPYGVAATEVFRHLNKEDASPVYGNNVAQTFTFVSTGNVDAGLVALSQVLALNIDPDNYWVVPANYHTAIEHQMVIMNRAAPEADQFALWLATESPGRIIASAGYLLPEPHDE